MFPLCSNCQNPTRLAPKHHSIQRSIRHVFVPAWSLYSFLPIPVWLFQRKQSSSTQRNNQCACTITTRRNPVHHQKVSAPVAYPANTQPFKAFKRQPIASPFHPAQIYLASRQEQFWPLRNTPIVIPEWAEKERYMGGWGFGMMDNYNDSVTHTVVLKTNKGELW